MICANEYYSYSFDCIWMKKEWNWFWILIPLVVLILCLFYIFSRPNYVRLTNRTYQNLNTSKNAISFYPQKQHDDTFDQYSKDVTPSSSSLSKFLFEQRENENKRHVHSDKTKYKTIQQVNNHSNILTSSKLLNYSSMNNNSSDLLCQSKAYQYQCTEELTGSDLNSMNIGRKSRIYFFLAYNLQLRYLYLNIIKAQYLERRNNDLPSTFVRIDIGPRLNETFSTAIIENNANPNYMTEIIFKINLSEFSSNVLKLSVYEVMKENVHVPIGIVYYPLEHLLIAQHSKGHTVWRDLLPEYGKPTTMSLFEINANVWYNTNDEYLNIDLHSLRSMGMLYQIYYIYIHALITINSQTFPIKLHSNSSLIVPSRVVYEKYGPIVSLNQSNNTIYHQLFRFLVRQDELDMVTVVLDVYHRALDSIVFDDILLGRTVIISPEMSLYTSKGDVKKISS